MDNGMISKIQKARQYAEERDRISFTEFTVTFDGENHPHTVHFTNNIWQCDCGFFQTRQVCSHTMALERLLEGLIPVVES